MKSRIVGCLAGLVLMLLMVGCGKSDPTSDSPLPSGMGTPTGNAVFDNHCLRCHAASAGSENLKKNGPNLTKVGATRSVDWLAEHVKNPKTHKPGSMMPEFASKLSADEIKSVSEFMASLK